MAEQERSGSHSGSWRGSRSGLTLRSPRFEEETRAHLQRRLRLMTGALSVLLWGLIAAFVASMAAPPDQALLSIIIEFCTRFPNSMLFYLGSGVLAIHTLLRSRELSYRTLAILDGLLLQILIFPCLYLYARLHFFSFSGFAYALPFLILFIMTRAVLVPSTVLRTALVSAPAPLGMLAIQLWYGDAYSAPGASLGRAYYLDSLIQNQVCLLSAAAVAAIASRVNLVLRRNTYNARRVGQYQLESVLGAGAMGEVYRATHALLKRPTAVKFLRPEIAGEETLRRFEREVRQTARLSHPNTVSIYDYGHTADGVFYYAMELLEGANLREVVGRAGPLAEGRVIHILERACAALQEAHSKGIVHRDLKPANLMLCHQGGEYDVVKILDFGLAKVLSEDGQGPTKAVGTPETIAPESLLEATVDHRADLYSLSAIAYYLLTGRPVFDVSSLQACLRAHLRETPTPPSTIVPNVPEDLERLVLQGLSKKPEERPASAEEMRRRALACRNAGEWTPESAEEWWTRTWPKLADQEDSQESPASKSSMMTRLDLPDSAS